MAFLHVGIRRHTENRHWGIRGRILFPLIKAYMPYTVTDKIYNLCQKSLPVVSGKSHLKQNICSVIKR